MKKVSMVLVLLLAAVCPAQNTYLTIEEAILGRGLQRVERIADLDWMGDTNRFCYTDTLHGRYGLITGDAAGEDTMLVPLDSLNRSLAALDIAPLARFPRLEWADNSRFNFRAGDSLIEYDVFARKAAVTLRADRGLENLTTGPDRDRAAHTSGGDVYLLLESGRKVRVTHDGGSGISNGPPDVHRSEFGINKGIFWSPGGNRLAYYRRDETMVSEYPLVDIDSRPAEVRMIRYPMAGMVSEEVQIHVYDVHSGSKTRLQTGEPRDRYFPQVTWSPDGSCIYVAELNRDQNRMRLVTYDPYSGERLQVLFTESSEKWVEPDEAPVFINDDPERFIWFSRRDGFKNLYLYSKSGRLISRLTSLRQDISRISRISADGRYLFFEAASHDGMDSDLYRLTIRSGKTERLTDGGGIHRCTVSSDGRYFLDRFSSSSVPARITLHRSTGHRLRLLLDAPDPLAAYTLGEVRLVKIAAESGDSLNARMILPADFDPKHKYPVIVYVYGGPHGQMIRNQQLSGWQLWFHYMTQQGYIVFSLDNRGTNNRGLAFEQAVFRRLGEIEVKDQMAGIDFLRAQPWVDESRIGVHGWSYGGFMTVSMMSRHPDVFKAGAAGGPVIDWQYYEVMYGERYMDTPQANPQGYEQSCLLNYVDQLQGKLLLIHGTVDPVVVWQHSLKYLRRAIDAGKQVDYFVYPGDEHNMRGRDRLHLYQKITDYFLMHL